MISVFYKGSQMTQAHTVIHAKSGFGIRETEAGGIELVGIDHLPQEAHDALTEVLLTWKYGVCPVVEEVAAVVEADPQALQLI